MPSTPGTVNYPTALDDSTSLIAAANRASTTLASTFTAGDTTAHLTDASLFSTSGTFTVENEIVYYTGKATNDLTGCVRGQEGTTNATHAGGVTVEGRITARHHTVLADALLAVETELGVGARAASIFSRRSGTAGTIKLPAATDFGVTEQLMIGATSSVEIPGDSSLVIYNVGGQSNASAFAVVTVAPSGDATGATDYANLQAALTAARRAGGGTISGVAGGSYVLNASLVIGSNTMLNTTGCSVTEAASVGDHLIQNYSWGNPVATASDGAITSGSNVVTTVLGAAATIGQTLVVAGAGGNGNGVLIGQVSAATSTTITLVRLRDGQPLNATHTVAAASVKLHNRDSNVSIIGGRWNLGGNSPNPYPAILAIHLDNLRIDIEGYTAVPPTGSRGVGVADVRGFFLRVPNISTTSVGVQVNGPADGGRIEYVGGTCSDDLLAITAGDYTINSNQMVGDITNVSVGTVHGIATAGKFLNVIAGAGWLVDGLRVEEIVGSGTAGMVYLGDDATDVGTVGGAYGEIGLGLINAVSTTSNPLNLSSPDAARITARIRHNPITSSLCVGIGGASTATIKQLVLSGSSTGTTQDWVYLSASGVTINSLVLDQVAAYGLPSGGFNMVNVDAGAIDEVVLRDCRLDGNGQTQYAVLVGGGSVGRAHFFGGYYATGAHVVNTHGQTVPIQLIFDGCRVTGFGRLAQLSTATTAFLRGVMADGQSYELFNMADSSTLTLKGDLASGPTNGLLTRSAAQSIKVNSPQLQTDVTLLTPDEGDLCYNTNAALPCGVGVAIYHSGGIDNGWKNLDDDASASMTFQQRSATVNSIVLPLSTDFGICERLTIGATKTFEIPATSSLTIYNVS